MMFSERLEYGKYDFQHLQGAAWAKKERKNMDFSWIFDDFPVWGLFGPITGPTFRPDLPTLKSIISENIGGIFFGQKYHKSMHLNL